MENEQQRLVLFAEDATIDTERSDIFLIAIFKLCDNAVNQNKQGVSAKFISSVVEQQDKYDTLPLYADVATLMKRDYDHLYHNYDPQTNTFDTDQIGSFASFKMEADDNGVISLYGEARIPRRQEALCEKIAELYEMGKLNVSFEIRYNPEHMVEREGVRFVDAAEDNYLCGLCVVSKPAYKTAVCLDLVAEETVVAGEETGDNEVNKTMDNEEMKVEVAEVTPAAEPETEVAIADEAQAEVIEHHVTVEEHVHECQGEEPVHVVEVHEMTVETIEPEPVVADTPDYPHIIAEKDNRIAELENQIAELMTIKAEYDRMVAEAKELELARKRNACGAFAEKQGLDLTNAEVAEAVANLDYEMIASITMRSEEKKETKTEEVAVASVSMTHEMEIQSKYGNLLDLA